jgi:hypothetical protein
MPTLSTLLLRAELVLLLHHASIWLEGLQGCFSALEWAIPGDLFVLLTPLVSGATITPCITSLGSFISRPIQRKLRFGHIIAGCCWLFALGWLLYTFVPNLLTLALVTAFLMLLDPIYDVAQYSRRAAIIPDALMGRVQSRLIALSTPALGYALIGPLLQYLGRRPTVLFFEIFLLLLALLATFNRHVQQAGPLDS